MKKIFTIFAALTLSAGLMAETVPYIDEAGEFQTADATEITSASEPVTWGTAGTSTWYVVKGEDVQLSQGAVCVGDVRLILGDGAKLTATGEGSSPGIEVSGDGNSLTIYGQANQSGQLIANGEDSAAGIGGENSQDGSNINICGGVVTATGGYDAAGIGGGNGADGYNITIYGGVVTATGGDYAAGIGGGSSQDGSNINIYGGVVTAKGGFSGAGIGGGYAGSGSNITINGGVVTATGGENAAGIGGGWGDFGSNISINGGVVTATGGNNGAGIGSGHEGPASSNIYVATNLVVKAGSAANPTTVITNTGADLASNLADKQYATVEPKPVPHKSDHFVDATSGLRFEVTAVGEANTVKVTDNNYTGTSYIVPDTVKYLDVDFAVTEIGYRAFKSCSALQSIDLPNVTKIWGEAFFDCTSLSTITLPASLTTIGIGTFSGCEGLTSVTFLGNACTIGEDVFAGVGKDAPALLTLPNNWTGTLPDEDGKWYGGVFNLSEEPTKTSVITYTAEEKLPETTGGYASGLHTNAFYAADSTLLTITEHSFNNGVGTITLNGEVAIIGNSAFYKCEKMTAIEIPNTVTHLGKGALEYLYKLTSLTLPEGLIEIGENALYGDTSLVSLTIPASVTTIGKKALFSCFNLTSLVIEADNTKYDSRDNCSAVIETATNTLLFGAGCTTIPATVTTIAEYAFYSAHLTSLVIPASVDSIGGYAFLGCKNLASVTFESNACQGAIGGYAFNGVGSSTPALLTLPNNWTGSKPDEDGSWYGGKFVMSSTPTALPTLFGDGVKANKFLYKGQLFIRKAGKHFNAVGAEL